MIHHSRFTIHARCRLLAFVVLAFHLTLGYWAVSAPIPAPDRLLPDDTLFLITTPDFPRLRAIFDQSHQARLLDEPVLKPFKDNFIAKWTEDIAKPLERDLNLNLDDYTNLLQGQFTVALVRAAPALDQDPGPGMLLLLDTKAKSNQLKSNLARLRKKWVDSGKLTRVEKIRDVEFFIVAVGTNEAPRTFQQFFPHSPEVQQLGADTEAKKSPPKFELVIGRADSLLIVANSVKTAEKVVAHMSGSGAPALADLADYQANHPTFRDAPLYAWFNLKLMDQAGDQKPAQPRDNEPPDPFPAVKQDRYLAATGLMGVRTMAISLQDSSEGELLQMTFSAPESSRHSLFKLPPTDPRDCGIPPFVPADAVKFQRWRLDGQKAWAAFEKFLSEASPQAFNGITAILDLANQNARQRDPSFDIRRNLIGNLGDDLITYEKVPRSFARPDLEAPPSIALLSSPNPEQFVSALQNILIFMSAQADKPAEREFLGRKILSVPLPSLAIPFLETKPRPPRTIHYAASGGYVALSTDDSMLEEFLRRSDNQTRPLRETAGLTDAAQRVLGPGTIVFGFDNQSETYRAKFEQWKLEAASATNAAAFNLPIAPFNPSNTEKNVSDWMDFSLLPPFDSVSKYFHFNVYGVSASVDGFTFKYFLATPPALRATSPAAAVR